MIGFPRPRENRQNPRFILRVLIKLQQPIPGDSFTRHLDARRRSGHYPLEKKLRQKLRGLEITRLSRSLPPHAPPRPESDLGSVADARKILRLSKIKMLKSRLRKIEKSSILCSEFIEICKETCSDDDQGLEFAAKLDESGDVIV
ncbi:hypothetical protein FXO38_17977 [Capsicum annuum]|nr:hypothetical protein FXO38_17977 [Capsicum annuum]